jgi:quercetin dioxygenase-like cupin family protein
MLERAIENGYRRKRLLERDDAHLTYVEMGPGWVVPPHSHSTGEVIFLLEGSLTPDSTGEALHAGDSISVPAHASYGFTCGGEGVRFLVMRPGEATVTLDE